MKLTTLADSPSYF